MVTAKLLKKTHGRRIIDVHASNGRFIVEYNPYGLWFETIYVNQLPAVRKCGYFRLVPHFEFQLGPHKGVINIRSGFLGPILGHIKSFTLSVDGEVVYSD